jgi:hypothetical protein
MSFLKKLLGTTDAMAEARKAVPAAGGSAPHGWNVTSPEVEQTDTEVILRMDASGLDASSLESSVDGDALVVKAHGTTDTGSNVSLNERFKVAARVTSPRRPCPMRTASWSSASRSLRFRISRARSRARRGRGSGVPVSDTVPSASPKSLASDGIVVAVRFACRHFSSRPGVGHGYGSVTCVPQEATSTRPSCARDSTASRSRSAKGRSDSATSRSVCARR